VLDKVGFCYFETHSAKTQIALCVGWSPEGSALKKRLGANFVPKLCAKTLRQNFAPKLCAKTLR
jgi:hypothetical protein